MVSLLTCSAIATKQKSILFEGASAVVSFDDKIQGVRVRHDTSILVTGDKIISIYPASQRKEVPVGTVIVPSQGKIITPGFVDTHRHLWQTALKTLASNTTLSEYFHRYGEFAVARSSFTAEDVYYGQLAGIYDLLTQELRLYWITRIIPGHPKRLWPAFKPLLIAVRVYVDGHVP